MPQEPQGHNLKEIWTAMEPYEDCHSTLVMMVARIGEI